MKFANFGREPIAWKLEHSSTTHKPVSGFNSTVSTKHIPSSCPVYFYPDQGTILPGATECIEIEFTPHIAQYRTNSVFNLLSEEFDKTPIAISGTGGNSILVMDDVEKDFGIIRVGQIKERQMMLKNIGMMKLSFFVECSKGAFTAEPEQGQLSSGESKALIIKYFPKLAGYNQALVKITSFAKDPSLNIPREMLFFGKGSYPDLMINTKLIDFNIALFKSPNRRPISVENRGDADAILTFSCIHPNIRIETETSELVIAAQSKKDIYVVYTPQIVEKLNSRIFISSSDNRGDSFMIALKGNVGIPKLCIIRPANWLDSLLFGVMRLNQSIERSFTIFNDGTIFLNFSISLVPRAISQVASNVEKRLGIKRAVSNVVSPVTITPESGTIAVDEEVQITVKFLPTMLLDYEYDMLIKYDYQKIVGRIAGIGGKANLQNDSALKMTDFGTSRVGKAFGKTLRFTNEGNLGFHYIIRPEPSDGNWSIYDQEIITQTTQEQPDKLRWDEPLWAKELAASGFSIGQDHGFCAAFGKLETRIEFKPLKEKHFAKKLRIFYSDQYEEFEIQGSGAVASISLIDSRTLTPLISDHNQEIDLGIHPIKTVYVHYFDLVNMGPFPVDFLIEPLSAVEFEVFPRRGYVAAGLSIQLQLYFNPSSENRFNTTLRVLWEGHALKVKLFGTGGIGRLEIGYSDPRDGVAKSLDFGMVPFHSCCEKDFFLLNHGLVGIYCESQTDQEDYFLAQIGEIFPIEDKGKITPRGMLTWSRDSRIYLPPSTGVRMSVQYTARSATISNGDVTIKSDGGNFVIPLRGKGGTLMLTHKSDLSFGDISCNFTYSRKLTIVNGGSIPATLKAGWLVVGHSSQQSVSHVQLTEIYPFIDPRSRWARKYLALANKTGPVLAAKDYWALIRIMINKKSVDERYDAELLEDNSSKKSGRYKAHAESSYNVVGDTNLRKAGKSNFAVYFKRRQMFFHLINSELVTSQSAPKQLPHIKVSPAVIHLPSYGEVTFTCDLNLTSEDTFLATLVIKADVPNTPQYEVALQATPKFVNIYCNDTRILNFYRQPIGETEFLMRTISNVGHKEIPFKFTHSNPGLIIMPLKGTLKVGATVEVTFAFKPIDESTQTGDVLFEPAFSQPIRFKMYGGGGFAKPSLARFRRFDFGHCMIGKDTESFLPITNEGNALLHLTRFDLRDTETFFRGKDWPKKRISLSNGEVYQLPLVFCPHEENPLSGHLIVGTNSEQYDIELVGYGREAVLIVSKVALEFNECIIRNSYEQKFSLKNIGDVNYPVTFQLEKPFGDLEFKPNSLVINPFSESFVTVTYKPSHETRSTVVLTISSPYSVHKLPVLLHAGYVTLGFDVTELDFGMFERTTKPSLTMNVTNEGTVKTSVWIRDMTKPPLFSISPAKSFLLPGKSIAVKVTYVQHEVAQFEERLIIKSDLHDKVNHMVIRGQCEETVLIADEFCMMNMGICPVLEQTTRPLLFTNHGNFPLTYQIKNSYPLKVSPTSGTVLGKETSAVQVSWSPSGGYELRTQIQMLTNIGQFQVVVRAKAMFPELALSSTYVDFGVCALGHPYRHLIKLDNNGKVPLRYNIPACKETSFVTTVNSGNLAPKESISFEIVFTPGQMGKITGSIILECRGIHYKEIILVGVGGMMQLDINPSFISLGRCPFGLSLTQLVSFRNSGDVTLFIDFANTVTKHAQYVLQVPDVLVIPPNRSTSCQVAFRATESGRFSSDLIMDTKEKTYRIPFSGI